MKRNGGGSGPYQGLTESQRKIIAAVEDSLECPGFRKKFFSLFGHYFRCWHCFKIMCRFIGGMIWLKIKKWLTKNPEL